jgi:hypothetical protein
MVTNREPRLFMFVPETKDGSPQKNMEANTASVPTENAETKKAPHKSKGPERQRENYGGTVMRRLATHRDTAQD